MAFIQEKFKEKCENFVGQSSSSFSLGFEFNASTGWSSNFKRRSGIMHVYNHGDPDGADKEEFDEYCINSQIL